MRDEENEVRRGGSPSAPSRTAGDLEGGCANDFSHVEDSRTGAGARVASSGSTSRPSACAHPRHEHILAALARVQRHDACTSQHHERLRGLPRRHLTQPSVLPHRDPLVAVEVFEQAALRVAERERDGVAAAVGPHERNGFLRGLDGLVLGAHEGALLGQRPVGPAVRLQNVRAVRAGRDVDHQHVARAADGNAFDLEVERWQDAVLEGALEGEERLLRVLDAKDRPVVVDADKHLSAVRVGERDHLAGHPLWPRHAVLELEVVPLPHRRESLDVVGGHGCGGRVMGRLGLEDGLRLGAVERGGIEMRALEFGIPRHELPHRLGGIEAVEQDGPDGLRDRHLDAVTARELPDGLRRADALDDHRGMAERFGLRLASSHPLAKRPVAAVLAEARHHEIAQAGETRERVRVGAERQAQARDLGQTSRHERRLGVVAQSDPVRDARRHRHHVLDRPADLDANQVRVSVDA